MKRYTPLRRTGGLRARSSSATAKARRAAQDGPQAALCRTMVCVGCGAAPPNQAHHEPTKASGGLDRDAVPLCPFCHERRHRIGAKAFWAAVCKMPADIKGWLRGLVGEQPRCWLCGHEDGGHAPACKDVRAAAERRRTP